MKRFLLLCSLPLLTAGVAAAQTLHIVSGQVTTDVAASDAADMTFGGDGTTLTIMGTDYRIADLTQLYVDTAPVTARTVSVVYSAGQAAVSVSGDIAPYLTITATDGHVRIVASSDLQEEVTYTLSGTSDNGSFYMDGEYKATLVLDNLTLTNPSGAAIDIDNGKRIRIELPDGTETTLADGADGSQKACFFVNGHAELKGGGTLNISGNAKHAYASDEYTLLKSSFGTLNVTSAVSDGLHVQQYFQMDGGTVTISGTKGDCIDVSVTKDAEDELNGQALITGGTLSMDVSAEDVKGLKTDSALTITGGTVSAEVAGDGSKGFSVGTDLLIGQPTDTPTLIKMNVTGTTYMKDDPDLESKCRGIKVKGNFTFDGGTIDMNVTGKKAKGISVDGTYTYKSGTTNVIPS